MSIWIPTALDLSNTAPVDFRWVSVLLVAGDHAALAADALRHVKVKAMLFSCFRQAVGNSGEDCERFDLVQWRLGRWLPLSTQDKPDAVILRLFDKR